MSRSPGQTASLGAAIGRLLQAGDVIGFSGDLGAGKTRMIQGIARGLGIRGTYVNSPTFTMVNVYPGRIPLYHVDLYRISGSDEAETIGIGDILASGGACVIEWFEKLPEVPLFPHCRVRISIDDERTRTIKFEPRGERYEELCGGISRYGRYAWSIT